MFSGVLASRAAKEDCRHGEMNLNQRKYVLVEQPLTSTRIMAWQQKLAKRRIVIATANVAIGQPQRDFGFHRSCIFDRPQDLAVGVV